MRQLTPSEILSMREMLQAEVLGLKAAEANDRMIKDTELKNISEAGIQVMRAKISEMQRFIKENNVVPTQEVH